MIGESILLLFTLILQSEEVVFLEGIYNFFSISVCLLFIFTLLSLERSFCVEDHQIEKKHIFKVFGVFLLLKVKKNF
jgi:hypothetical protein